MNHSLNNLDLSIIILLIVLMLSKSIYNLYVINNFSKRELRKIRDIVAHNDHNELLPVFSAFNLLTAVIFFASSIYFFVENKIKTKLFGFFCLYMFSRAIGYFSVLLKIRIPGLTKAEEDLYIYENIRLVSIITIGFSLYLISYIF